MRHQIRKTVVNVRGYIQSHDSLTDRTDSGLLVVLLQTRMHGQDTERETGRGNESGFKNINIIQLNSEQQRRRWRRRRCRRRLSHYYYICDCDVCDASIHHRRCHHTPFSQTRVTSNKAFKCHTRKNSMLSIEVYICIHFISVFQFILFAFFCPPVCTFQSVPVCIRWTEFSVRSFSMANEYVAFFFSYCVEYIVLLCSLSSIWRTYFRKLDEIIESVGCSVE